MKTVCIIDDDLDIADILSEMIVSDGFDCIVLSDLTNIVDVIIKIEPDLVVTDVFMRDMTGVEIANELGKRSFRNKILFYTGVSYGNDPTLDLVPSEDLFFKFDGVGPILKKSLEILKV